MAIDLNVPLQVLRERADDELTKAYVVEALRATSGNVTRAAEMAGVNRKFIQRAIQQYRLRIDDPEE